MENEDKILTELNVLIRGNGNEESGLMARTKKLEDNFHIITIKLTIVVVLLLVLISAQAPVLLAAIRGV